MASRTGESVTTRWDGAIGALLRSPLSLSCTLSPSQIRLSPLKLLLPAVFTPATLVLPGHGSLLSGYSRLIEPERIEYPVYRETLLTPSGFAHQQMGRS